MPLPPFPTKRPLRDDRIGPPFALVRSGSNHDTSTQIGRAHV